MMKKFSWNFNSTKTFILIALFSINIFGNQNGSHIPISVLYRKITKGETESIQRLLRSENTKVRIQIILEERLKSLDKKFHITLKKPSTPGISTGTKILSTAALVSVLTGGFIFSSHNPSDGQIAGGLTALIASIFLGGAAAVAQMVWAVEDRGPDIDEY